MTSISVAIPVKDGGRHLARVLAAVRTQGDALGLDELELLVVDSGSRDGSVELARAAGARVHEIAPEEFGHGRTRNVAAELTGGEAICFLTQDAVPADGWLAAHLEALALDERVGASYGPHLPVPDTSPMIARELEQFFASMSPGGGPVLQRAGDLAFLSNVNACYRRGCWEQIRFEDLDYAEDQAFGRAMLEAGWLKAYHPRAAVHHAHDYGPVEFARRYFDEYRGLRETSGHVEPARPARVGRELRDAVASDRRWMAQRGWGAGRRAGWTARSALHHATRKAAAVAATRPGSLPAAVERRLSLEGRASRGDRAGGAPGPARAVAPADRPAAQEQPAKLATPHFDAILRHARDGVAPLERRSPRAAERERLHVAWVVPPFRRGSGGHSTIFQMVRRLEQMGHTCTIWIHDAGGSNVVEAPAAVRRNIVTWFQPVQAPAFVGFDHWHGADVAVATGWDTAHAVAMLGGCGARAYFVQDHEPEFFATSAERMWAERSYDLGLFPICAGRWLHDLIAREHGCEGTWFELGVDHEVYRPLDVERRRDTVVFYARAATPRRAVPLGVLALEELSRRRPDTRVVAFGQTDRLKTTFAHRALGVASPEQLAWAYSEASAGLCVSLTNYSLIPQEMMACGLPCVDVEGGSSEAIFGNDGGVELAPSDPLALADALERLLEDRRLWERRSHAGLEHAREACWERAAESVEHGLRAALSGALVHA